MNVIVNCLFTATTATTEFVVGHLELINLIYFRINQTIIMVTFDY